MLPAEIVLALRPPAAVSNGRGGTVKVRVPGATLGFPGLDLSVARALRRLEPGAPEATLARIAAGENDARLTIWYHCLRIIEQHGGITYTVRARRTPLARAMVLTRYFTPGRANRGARDRRVLSRFAYLRRAGDHLVVESPLSCARVELLHPTATAVVGALIAPCTAHDVAAAVPQADERSIAQLLWLLDFAGMITGVDAHGRSEEEQSQVLRTWHFADLLFHARSRGGRHDEGLQIFKHRRSMPFLPVVKPAMSSETVDLYAPSIAALGQRDAPLTRIIERRRSIRAHGARPLGAKALGEFLYRVARVKRIVKADGNRLLYDASVRPYPGGGACYELELYVAVNRCHGLLRGLYHYDPLHHRLEVLPGGARHVPGFMRDARTPLSVGRRHVLIIAAARFQRMTWKYNSSTYGAILKNVGVLFQTMYLVATAMKLAPCALGAGNSERFAHAVGTDYLEETSVGEFMLGRQ